MKMASLAVLLALQAGRLTAARAQNTPKRIEIRTLSTRADRVSGGDVLIEIVASGIGTAKAVPYVPASSPTSPTCPGPSCLIGSSAALPASARESSKRATARLAEARDARRRQGCPAAVGLRYERPPLR